MKTLLTLVVTLILVCSHADAKAHFQARSELITKASVIAIIELQEPEAAKPDRDAGQQGPFGADGVVGKTWTYSTQAKAKLVKLIKGEIPKEFMIYGGESFICAQCTLAKGKYLAFLNKDGDCWVGSNWQLSLRPIKGDKVEWYVSEEQKFPMKNQALDKVLAEIQEILAKTKKGE